MVVKNCCRFVRFRGSAFSAALASGVVADMAAEVSVMASSLAATMSFSSTADSRSVTNENMDETSRKIPSTIAMRR